jgi:hypothetical protein
MVDVMGESSFPASDPPAVWTWDINDRPDAGASTEAGRQSCNTVNGI